MPERRLLLVPDLAGRDSADDAALALLDLDGVDHVEVDLGQERIEIELDPDLPADYGEIEQALDDIGLTVERIEEV